MTSLRSIAFLAFILWFMGLEGCVSTKMDISPGPVIDLNTAEQVIRKIRKQALLTKNFVFYGEVFIKEGHSKLNAHVMIAATHTTLKKRYQEGGMASNDGCDGEDVGIFDRYNGRDILIKIEVTHFWGRPICHVLLRDGFVKVLLFSEKRMYIQPVDHYFNLAGVLPVSLDICRLWGILRGYPELKAHAIITVTQDNRIALVDRDKRYVEVILCSDRFDPCVTFFPDTGVTVMRSDFVHDKELVYAQRTLVKTREKDFSFEIRIKQAFFNTDIPPDIFRITLPKGYETVMLDSSMAR